MSSSTPIASTNIPVQLRYGLLAFAILTCGLSGWLLAAEIARPPSVPSNVSRSVTSHRSDASDRALRAANIGVLRGDLWADAALATADALWNQASSNLKTDTPIVVDSSQRMAQRALRYAPHDSRIWLLLADLAARFDWLNRKAAAALRMSYYTAASEFDLMPSRLMVAVRSNAIAEDDVQNLAAREIRAIITKRPDLKPAIRIAYDDAPPEGRRFIEQTLSALDPALLVIIRSWKEQEQ